MALDQITRLRQLIGERIPPGGGVADTMFTDIEVQDFLDRAGNSLYQAAYIGWQTKAATYAGLVSTTEGNASRLNSDLHEHATEMMKYYEGYLTVTVQGRTRVGKIVRPGGGPV